MPDLQLVPPADGAVHLWRIDLRGVARAAAAGQGWCLSHDEQDRAARLSDAAGARSRFIAARIALRRILAGYLGIDPEKVALGYGPLGKPALAGDGAAVLSFNLSHAAGRALCAVADGRPVGVDIELIRPVPGALAIARETLAPADIDALHRLQAAARNQAFLCRWTRREAGLKAAGLGLAYAALPHPAAVPAARARWGDGGSARAWSFRDLELPPSYLGALAVAGDLAELRCMDFLHAEGGIGPGDRSSRPVSVPAIWASSGSVERARAARRSSMTLPNRVRRASAIAAPLVVAGLIAGTLGATRPEVPTPGSGDVERASAASAAATTDPSPPGGKPEAAARAAGVEPWGLPSGLAAGTGFDPTLDARGGAPVDTHQAEAVGGGLTAADDAEDSGSGAGLEAPPAALGGDGTLAEDAAPVTAALDRDKPLWAVLGEGFDISALVGAELRAFPQDPAFPNQDEEHLLPSVFGQFELVYEWNEGGDRLTLLPFGRWAPRDDSRTHVDLREANWLHIADRWDLLVGISRVFWGVTESRHLVDIVNQIDTLEGLDGEEKLGQPMVNLNLLTDLGTLSLFALPGFRERPFPDADERLSGPLPIDEDAAVFDSDLENASVAFAARYTNTFGPIDLGLAHFYGTSREPRFMVRGEGADMEIVPRYDLIHQTSLDVQATLGNWQWKLEALTRSGQGDRFQAAVGGVEYTVFDAFGTDASVGLLAEYLYDDREDTFTPFLSSSTAFDDDIFLGTRLLLNDVAGTRLLAGAVVDREDQTTALKLEAERRLGDSWLLQLEGWGFLNVDSADPLTAVDHDDFIQLRLLRFF